MYGNVYGGACCASCAAGGPCASSGYGYPFGICTCPPLRLVRQGQFLAGTLSGPWGAVVIDPSVAAAAISAGASVATTAIQASKQSTTSKKKKKHKAAAAPPPLPPVPVSTGPSVGALALGGLALLTVIGIGVAVTRKPDAKGRAA